MTYWSDFIMVAAVVQNKQAAQTQGLTSITHSIIFQIWVTSKNINKPEAACQNTTSFFIQYSKYTKLYCIFLINGKFRSK